MLATFGFLPTFGFLVSSGEPHWDNICVKDGWRETVSSDSAVISTLSVESIMWKRKFGLVFFGCPFLLVVLKMAGIPVR